MVIAKGFFASKIDLLWSPFKEKTPWYSSNVTGVTSWKEDTLS